VDPLQHTKCGTAPRTLTAFTVATNERRDKRGSASLCNHGIDFVTACENENIFATQFHPDKSQIIGLHLLKNFLDASSMLKKRLVFSLLYENGFFMLSGNPKFQRIGKLE